MIEEQKMKPPAGFERLEAVQEAYEPASRQKITQSPETK